MRKSICSIQPNSVSPHVPAESMFQGIAKLLPPSEIKVATSLDIHQRRSLTRRSEITINGVVLMFPQVSNLRYLLYLIIPK
jgi:hypothetical protein